MGRPVSGIYLDASAIIYAHERGGVAGAQIEDAMHACLDTGQPIITSLLSWLECRVLPLC